MAEPARIQSAEAAAMLGVIRDSWYKKSSPHASYAEARQCRSSHPPGMVRETRHSPQRRAYSWLRGLRQLDAVQLNWQADLAAVGSNPTL